MTHDFLLLRYALTDGTPLRGTLTLQGSHYYGPMTVGHRRFWESVQNATRIDKAVEIPGDPGVSAGQYVFCEGDYWRIEEAQHTFDDDGLPVVRLSLRRWEGTFDVVRPSSE